MNTHKKLQYLYKISWETRASRFNAARRLNRRALCANLTVALASALLILISTIPIDPTHKNISMLLSIAGALVILVISLWELARNSSVRAERLQKCAEQLSEIYNEVKKFDGAIEPTIEEINEINNKYNDAIKSCAENHDTLDFDKHKASHPSDYHNSGKTILSRALWHLSCLDVLIYTIAFTSAFVYFGEKLIETNKSLPKYECTITLTQPTASKINSIALCTKQ